MAQVIVNDKNRCESYSSGSFIVVDTNSGIDIYRILLANNRVLLINMDCGNIQFDFSRTDATMSNLYTLKQRIISEYISEFKATIKTVSYIKNENATIEVSF